MNAKPSFYLIAYDLRKPGQDYDRMEEKINELEDQIKILETTWIVKTILTSAEIKQKILDVVDGNDHVYICRIDLLSSAGRLKSEARKWISEQQNAL